MAHDVFISHAAEDKILADAVCAALEAAGIRCWIAPRDVLAGRDWAESIVEAVNEARVMVLIYSAKAADSPHVKKELTLGVGSGTVIVPLRIEDVPLTGMMQFYLMDTHWLDAMNPPSQHEIALLVDTVKSLLHGASHLERPVGDVVSDTVTDTSVTPSTVPDPENAEDSIVDNMTPPQPPINPTPQPPQPQYAPPPPQQPYPTQQQQYAPPQPQYGAPAPQPPKSKKTLWIVLAIVGVLILGCIGTAIAGISLFSKAADEVVDQIDTGTGTLPGTGGTDTGTGTGTGTGAGFVTLSWNNTDDLDIELYSAASGDYIGSSWDLGGVDSQDGTVDQETWDLRTVPASSRVAEGYYVAVINNSTVREEWVPFTLTIQDADGSVATFQGQVNGFPPQDEWVAAWIDDETGAIIEEVRLYVDGTTDGTGDGSGTFY